MIKDQCRVCRRSGQKLFLKGDRCFSPKCALVKRNYPPGAISKKRRSGAASEYKKALNEKQKLRKWYGMSEHQFKQYVQDILARRGKVQNISDELIRKLEKRLDNVVFRLGFAKSRNQARQLVSHAFFTVNGKAVNIPSFATKVGDIIAIKEIKKKKSAFNELAVQLKKKETSTWLEINKDTFVGKVKSEPSLAEIVPPAELSVIFEFYSR
jgi:small subunit ribosomal protein S4